MNELTIERQKQEDKANVGKKSLPKAFEVVMKCKPKPAKGAPNDWFAKEFEVRSSHLRAPSIFCIPCPDEISHLR